MIYYYAHTGHKVGLDRARRGTAVVKALQQAGVEATLLSNDFRAGVAMQELGLRDYITVETVWDVDAAASEDDSVIFDTFEDDQGKLKLYAERFACVGHFGCEPLSSDAKREVLFCDRDEATNVLSPVIVDEVYTQPLPKEDRLLFFFGDADYDKVILQHDDFFRETPMELLWGHYFFIKYEAALASLFSTVHESEAYETLIRSSATVVTASSQTAMEAKAAGVKVVYIAYEAHPCYDTTTLNAYGIAVIDGFDKAALHSALKEDNPEATRRFRRVDVTFLADFCSRSA